MTATPQVQCARCRKGLFNRDHFEIHKRLANGQIAATTALCSYLCILQWGQQQALILGVAGINKIKQFADTIFKKT